jgi:hypothetical protein
MSSFESYKPTYQSIKVPGSNKIAFVLKNAYTSQECLDMIKISEDKGYITAKVNVGDREILALVCDIICVQYLQSMSKNLETYALHIDHKHVGVLLLVHGPSDV